MNRLSPKQIFIFSITLIVLIFLIIKSFSVNGIAYQKYRQSIILMEQKDAIVKQELLKLRQQLITSYDPIVKTLSDQKILHKKLLILPDFINNSSLNIIKPLLKQIEDFINFKEQLSETFKSKDAAFKNSIHYLPNLVDELQKAAQDQSWSDILNKNLNNLLYYTLLYQINPNEIIKNTIQNIINELQQLTKTYNINQTNFPIKIAIQHNQIIINNQPIIDQVTDQLVNTSISLYTQPLAELLENQYQQAVKYMNIYRILTYIWSVLIILIITNFIIKNLVKTNQQISHLNKKISGLNKQLQADNLRMGAELKILRQIQQMILPKSDELASIDFLDLAGYMESADEVGGDYYDILYTDGVVTIGIGDVTGHGLESGVLMVMTQTVVRTLTEIRESDPVKFLDILNRTIYKNIQRMNTDKNLTLAILNYYRGKISISGQHEEAIVVRRNGLVDRIDTIDLGFPIGLDEQIADFISHTMIEIEAGDGIVLYTDGIPEAENINKEQYGLDRFCHIISQNWDNSANQIKDIILADLRKFIGNQKVFDDITLVVIKQK